MGKPFRKSKNLKIYLFQTKTVLLFSTLPPDSSKIVNFLLILKRFEFISFHPKERYVAKIKLKLNWQAGLCKLSSHLRTCSASISRFQEIFVPFLTIVLRISFVCVNMWRFNPHSSSLYSDSRLNKSFHPLICDQHNYTNVLWITRTLRALRAPTSTWRPLRPFSLWPSRTSGPQAAWPTQITSNQ